MDNLYNYNNRKDEIENDSTWLWILLVVIFATSFLSCGIYLCYYYFYFVKEDNTVRNPEMYKNMFEMMNQMHAATANLPNHQVENTNNRKKQENVQVIVQNHSNLPETRIIYPNLLESTRKHEQQHSEMSHRHQHILYDENVTRYAQKWRRISSRKKTNNHHQNIAHV